MSVVTWQEVVESAITYIGRAGYPLNQIKYYLEKDTIRTPVTENHEIVEKSKLMNYEQVCELMDGYLKLKPSYIRIYATTSLDDEVLISIDSGLPDANVKKIFAIAYSLDIKIKII